MTTPSSLDALPKPRLPHVILGISPLEHPDAHLVLALCRAGFLGVLDVGRDAQAAERALDLLANEAPGAFGVRIPPGVSFEAPLPAGAEVVVLTAGVDPAPWRSRYVLVQVTSVEEAQAAQAAGADGLIAKGAESGGRVGAETSFVLLQRLVAATDLSIWVQGGVGLHTAAACIAGGAVGVVLDSQLALVRESTLPGAVKTALGAMDGSETVVLEGQRVFTRPDLPVARYRAGDAAGSVQERLGGTDLAQCFLPAGQDAAFARPLANRFRTAAGVVHAIGAAIEQHLRAARSYAPLAEGSPLAKAHGVRYPIAQGPMTRVSDRAAFADAVSRAGGLPFLALSLLRGDEVRSLLRETRALLGDRAWGVGILGFVPEGIRNEQLEVIREFAPPAAIIAGGRPSQARPLDAQGTITYLHVPSPGLLDLFLKDGARRFVFEGRECGGHVGPRTSFALWEMQIERLLAFEASSPGGLAEVSVLFAGGVHDARSAAMVAAMAAPLAARGARIGVLMGTAYLFTEEAVTSGAIQPGFQEAAIACERTVLLETAPGHATRCVENAYVRAFLDEKHRLEAERKSPEAVWEALEQLNLGRLRIAAKGVRREGAELVQVDEERQRRDGMFMIGQVAALRASVCTMAELHEDVCDGATLRIAAMGKVEPPPAHRPPPADVAIVGIACVFPGAPDRHAFWANILAGRNAITEVPRDRWDTELYYDAEATGGEKSRSKWGGFLPAVPFDPLAYGIPPRSISAIEPVQLLALDVARRALDDAGYSDKPFDRERTSVIFGAEAGTDLSSAYGFRAMFPQFAGPIPAALDEHLPRLTEDSFPGVLANVIAGRIANRLDLGGVNYTVDAACAASLAAVDLAVKELTGGTSDMVLCGGADLHNSINDYLLFSSVHALSPTGACRTFDATADGIALGEGVACVVLKRLADAERDGDRVYAVIKGIAGSSDGRSLGLTAPRKEGQIRALERAYHASGVSPAEVGLVEAHGTGTVVGDRTELATLTDVYERAGAVPHAAALGSVKSQIGHTKCAAGLAGLIKVALALHTRVLPPTRNVRKPNPGYEASTSPFVFRDVPRPWMGEARRAAVSAFGFGGTNFHAVLAAHEGGVPASGIERWPAELFLFRAIDRAGALEAIAKLTTLVAGDVRDAELAGEPPGRLADLARGVSGQRRGDGPVQIAIVASSLADLGDKLRSAQTLSPDPTGLFVREEGATPGLVAFLFPGQGSQRPGMLADLFVAFPPLQRFLALGPRFVDRIFPPLAFTKEERAAQATALTDTRAAQPSLGMADLAVAHLVRSLGVRPDMLAGHSYGELAALCFAGALPESELVGLSEARAQAILAAAGEDPGTMAAATARSEAIAPLLVGLERVVIANHNAPKQTVISGPTAGVEAALARITAAGIAARAIEVACAFHSPLVARAPALFGARLASVHFEAPRIPVFSNATASTYPGEPEAIRQMLAEHVVLPVKFVEEIEAMYAAGARTFVEVGPGRVLSGLVGKILADKPHLAVACDRSGGPGLEQLLLALAALAVAGVPVDAAPLFAGREARGIDPEELPSVRLPATTWLIDGHLARPLSGEIPKGALRPIPAGTPPGQPLATPAPQLTPSADREGVVLDYLRSTREIIESQRQVMLGFLGATELAAVSSRRTIVSGAGAEATPLSLAPPTSRAAQAPLALSAGPAAAHASVTETLLAIVSERTGYPVEMLDLDLNLEAELSIDSIKRIEILGTLGQQLGFLADAGEARDRMIEQLATRKTLRGIVEWLDQREAGDPNDGDRPTMEPVTIAWRAGADGPVPDARPTLENTGVTPHSAVRSISTSASISKSMSVDFTDAPAPVAAPVRVTRRGVDRYVLAPQETDATSGVASALAGRTFAIIGDRAGVAEALAGMLVANGAEARVCGPDAGTEMTGVDALVDLSSFEPHEALEDSPSKPLVALFERAREAALGGATTLLAATHLGAPFGPEGDHPRAGITGLLRTLARELPTVSVRAVELDPLEPAAALAEHLCAELSSPFGPVAVAHARGARHTLVAAPKERSQGARSKRATARLGPASVVLVTGGARGITAAAAIALAKRSGCRLELVGRSPLPEGPEDEDLAAARDLPGLRRAIFARGGHHSPGVIEAMCQKLLAARAVRATLAEITAAGGTVRYHALDVRDQHAFGVLIDDIYAREGRLDGILHGAGVLEDKILAQKTRESFERVVDTKLAGALTIARKVRPDVAFVAFFSSIAGAFGNRGQVDYAAANDALDKLAFWLAPRVAGRVVSIGWGPWAGAGMVSPELEREYQRRGLGLIELDDGIASFLDELFVGDDEPHVLLTNAAPSLLAGRGEPSLRAALSPLANEPDPAAHPGAPPSSVIDA